MRKLSQLCANVLKVPLSNEPEAWNSHGLRLRLPRQIGYKNVKYLSHIKVVETVKNIGKGVGGANVEDGYAWYAGI